MISAEALFYIQLHQNIKQPLYPSDKAAVRFLYLFTPVRFWLNQQFCWTEHLLLPAEPDDCF